MSRADRFPSDRELLEGQDALGLALQEFDIGLHGLTGSVDALQGQGIQELHPPLLGLGQILAPDDGQGQVRVEIRRDLVLAVGRHLAVHLEPILPRPVKSGDAAHPGSELVVRVFSDDAVLDTHAVQGDVLLGVAQRSAQAHADLLRDEVHVALALGSGDAGRNPVLDLDAGVDLHQKRLPRGADDPFPGSDAVVPGLPGHAQGIFGDVFEHLFRVKGVAQGGGIETGRDLDALLMAGGLHRAIAGAEMDGVLARAIGQHLHFEVVEVEDALFDEHALVAELALGVALDAAQDAAELVQVGHFLDAHAPASGRGLDQDDGIAHPLLLLEFEQGLGDVLGFKVIGHGLVRSRHRGHAKLAGQALGVDLVPELADDLPGGTDEDELALTLGHAPGEAVILGKEAVAGMDGRGSGLIGHGEDFIGVEVGADPVEGLVSAKFARQDTVLAVFVRFGEKRHERQAELAAGLHDTDGYLTPVSDENFMFLGFAGVLHV